ncbi:MAG: glycosyltransferase [Burkholderiales bacterium]|nr:MAG: glycosyltransferase [Burkholderiales bacterium]
MNPAPDTPRLRPRTAATKRLSARLSVVVPTLDEAGWIEDTLQVLAPLRARGHEVIVADGGSSDATRALCRRRADAVVEAPRGRAAQMNAGAAAACGDVLLFLHADTRLPPQADTLVLAAVAAGAMWGRFDVHIAGRSPMFPLIAAAMNWRSRVTGIATGDQAIFVGRDAFERCGGFPAQPLMEDVEISRRLRAIARPACLRVRVLTSGRRWDRDGVWRTILLMWQLRWRYWRGASPEALARAYARAATE